MTPISINGVEVLIEDSESYLQINDINEKDIEGIWQRLSQQYPGYELCFCFRNMEVPEAAMSAIGARVIDDCIDMRLQAEDYKPCDTSQSTAALLTEADFDEFAALLDATQDSDFYWTSERTKKKMDIWRIYVCKGNGKIVGYTMLCIGIRGGLIGEIFCVEADSAAMRNDLISAAAHGAFENGKSTLLYMVDRDDAQEYEAALAAGLKVSGHYKGFSVMIPAR